MLSLEERLKLQARSLGFELAGIAPATPSDGFDRLRAWLDQGFAGEMNYMQRHVDARRDPASILKNVRSVVMVGMNYKSKVQSPKSKVNAGRVAQYAQGRDYHD